jgi:protocadherin-15
VANSLDREAQERYTLTVKAEDNGGKSNTATVNVHVLDVNDQTPEFVSLPYSFRVVEGQAGAEVGTVEAQDADIGENAVVHYSVVPEQDSLFKIDQLSGLIETVQELDFESQGFHNLVVQAQDQNGPQAGRVATATVTILVQDTSDEVPLFQQARYQAEVQENLGDQIVTTVTATDKDINGEITYEIVSGDQNMFEIDAKTGVIRTLKGLDYEHQRMHFVTVSTEEARGTFDIGMTSCTVEITVQDINDVSPVFVTVPSGRTIQVRNDAKIGAKIALVKATDGDGTEPGNLVRYQIDSKGSSEKASAYFGIDKESGEIEVLNDLTMEAFDEYRLEIRASDRGSPSLETSVTLIVRVQQVVTMSPELGVGFETLRYDLKLEENTMRGKVIQVLTLDQVPRRGLDIKCEIMAVKDSKGKVREGIYLKVDFVTIVRNVFCVMKRTIPRRIFLFPKASGKYLPTFPPCFSSLS